MQSVVVSGQILNSSQLLWVSSLHVRMKTIQSKMKALESSQHYTFIFQTLKGSVVGCDMWPKFACIYAFMAFLVTCKNHEDQLRNESTRVVTKFHPL